MRRFLLWLTAHLAPPRVIRDHGSRYLSRWYLRGTPTMHDGTSPFEDNGSPKRDAFWPVGIGLYLHCFHRGDNAKELHSHPFRWAVAILLSGGYVEERRGKDDVVRSRVVLPGRINILRAKDFHRVDLLGDESWSLFIAGPKHYSWGFWDRTSKAFTPWRAFIEKGRGGS